MIHVNYDAALAAEYKQLFDSCSVRENRKVYVRSQAVKIIGNRLRYETIAKVVDCPWWLIGVIHNMECGLDFSRHLHNGDPLTQRTFHVPAGRPIQGHPPFTFEASAIDALTGFGFAHMADKSIAHLLWKFESYNGLGYRQYHPQCLTPYLWSFTNHYTAGKYIQDGKFDPTAISLQCGIAALMKELEIIGAMK